jgi:outer membrane receptor protein involved in Fe transport
MYTSNNRQLQGLSPYVVNLSVGYDDTEGRSLNLAYNKMSERLRKVGLKNGRQEYPDQYETPPHLLDFTWQERLYEGLDMKFKARNLLDGEVIWTEGDNVTKRYKAGRYYEVSLSYKY